MSDKEHGSHEGDRQDDHGDHGKSIEIFVNGRKHTVKAKEVTFDEVVAFAFPGGATGPDVIFTVTYSRKRGDRPTGSLVAGQSVEVHDGMIFNVDRTTQS